MRRDSAFRPAVRRTSQTKFDASRALILERLMKCWDKLPEMKLGELICDSLAYQHMTPNFIGRLDDSRLVEIVEYYVMFGTKSE